jgi:rod shape-determining protein MreC
VRKRHAWGAVLIVLFALPVLRPEGVEVVERPVADSFAWFGKIKVLNPHLWGSSASADDEELSPRARALAHENAVLREGMAQRRRLETDLQALEEALDGLDRRPRALFARVLRTADASAYRRSVLIDRGSADGIRRGMAVVSGRVFVGTVDVVHGRSSLVKLVSDRNSRLEVAIRTTADVRLCGYVRGRGRGASDGALDVRFLRMPGDDVGRILPGAPVFTSNADALVPASLLVGVGTEVSDKDFDGMPHIRLKPALDLTRSTRVIVLMPSEPDAGASR